MSPRQVVVIGGSAGALEPLLVALPALPASFDLPIVIVLHVLPTAPSLIPALLGRACARPVVEVEDKQPLGRGTIHVAPPDYHVLLERDQRLALSVDERVHFTRPAIDVLFESAAYACREGTIGVLLSGSNADGVAGLAAIAEVGGGTLVQDPASARFPYMPAAAVQHLGTRARLAAPEHLASALVELVSP